METYFEHIHQLPSNTQPLFGKMTAQHMVEHLAFTIRFSNGASPLTTLVTPAEHLPKMRAFLYSDQNLSKNFLSPFLPQDGSLPTLRFPDMNTAKEDLLKEWKTFERYFENNPEAKPLHFMFGELNREEWVRFHRKHFRHHLEQFGIGTINDGL